MFELANSAGNSILSGDALVTDLRADDMRLNPSWYSNIVNSQLNSFKKNEVADTVGSGSYHSSDSDLVEIWESSFGNHVQSLPRVKDLRPALTRTNTEVSVNASPLQIWEGRVLTVNSEKNSMDVLLSAQMSPMPDHTGEIDLQWVSEQDLDLVKPGAVFYLTLYKRTKRGSVENSQELRFRRVPNWTRKQLQQVQNETKMLLSNVKAGRVAA